MAFPDNTLQPVYLYALVTFEKDAETEKELSLVLVDSSPQFLEQRGKAMAVAFAENGPGFELTYQVVQLVGAR